MAIDAEALESRNTIRHPKKGVRSKPTTAAKATPKGSPACNRAAARPRKCLGVDSASKACPTAHSPPIPRPVNERNRNSVNGPVANAVRAVPSEYKQTVHIRVRLRPY